MSSDPLDMYTEGVNLLYILKRIDAQDNHLPDSRLAKLAVGKFTATGIFNLLTSAGFDWNGEQWDLIDEQKYIEWKNQ